MRLNQRGVVLMHVLLLMMLMAWIAATVLQASLSRQILVRHTTDSNESRAALSAAQGQINSCLARLSTIPTIVPANPPTPATNCATAMPSISSCLGTQEVGTAPNNRPYAWAWCAAPVCGTYASNLSGANTGAVTACTCRFAVKVCAPNATCTAPSNPCGGAY